MVKIRSKQFVPHIIIIVIFFSLTPVCGLGQISIFHTSGYDENIFRDSSRVADCVHQTSLTLSKLISTNHFDWHIAYSGQITSFNEYTNRFFHLHQFDTEVSLPLSHHFILQTSFIYFQRFNKDDYTLYNYRNWRLSPQLRFLRFQQTPVHSGYYFRQRQYNELEYLNYTEQSAYVTIKHFFPTRTTIIANVNGYWKTYTASADEQDIIIQRRMPFQTGGSGSSGRGNSNGKHHGQPDDPPTPQPEMIDTLITTIHQIQQQRAQRWEAAIRLAQSITNSTGVRIDWTRQFASDTPVRYLSGQFYDYTENDELYDNPYHYNGTSWEIMLTQILPFSIQLKCYASTSERDYNYAPEKLSANRKDDEVMYGVDVNKSVTLPFASLRSTVNVSYQYMKNESNDMYFDYEFPLVLMSVQLSRN